METFQLKIVAYDKIFYDGKAQSLTIPAIDGELQILSYHESCVAAIKDGEIRVITAEGNMIPAVCGCGFAEVTSDNCVEVLVATVEKPEEIDVRRAREAKERAEERLRRHQSKMEYHRSAASLSRAMARLKEAGRYRR